MYLRLSRGVRRTVSLLVLFCIVAFLQRDNILKFIYPIEYEETVSKYSEEYGLDPSLVLGVIKVESKFRPDAVSTKGAVGLMQIMPDTGWWIAERMKLEGFKEEDLYQYDTNIKMGSWYIKNLIDEFGGNVETAVAAYNGGLGNVKKWLSDDRYSQDGENLSEIPFKETSDYVEKVMEAQKVYRDIYGGE